VPNGMAIHFLDGFDNETTALKNSLESG
jgi:hypothetical protein